MLSIFILIFEVQDLQIWHMRHTLPHCTPVRSEGSPYLALSHSENGNRIAWGLLAVSSDKGLISDDLNASASFIQQTFY